MRPFLPLLVSVVATVAIAGCADQNTVSGTIKVDPAVAKTLGTSDTLFIVARRADGPGGPPVAVKRIVGMTFPMTYTFTPQDVMMPGTPFTGKLNISASIKKSGIVGVNVPGDMAGSYSNNPVEVGAKDVDITLERLPDPK